MPGDPKECRQHAVACLRLAQTAASPEAREHFASIANTWLKLADELETTKALLAALNEDEQELRRSG